METITLHVFASTPRLDRYLTAECPGLSRSQAQRLIEKGEVLVNGSPTKASYAPVPGDVVEVHLPDPAPATPQAQDIALRILYEDDAMLVIDKPAGLAVHPGAGHTEGTLVNALLAHRPAVVRADLDPLRPGIVHRLDRDTSGILIIATTREAQARLQAAFKGRQVSKTYLTLVYGQLSPDCGAIDAPIGRDPHERTRMRVMRDGGRPARTEYTVREHLRGCTYLEAHPITGRTHQLRVHLAAIGHPVVGDARYGPRRGSIACPRQFLHAARLELAHPLSGTALSFGSELPADLAAVLQHLRGSS